MYTLDISFYKIVGGIIMGFFKWLDKSIRASNDRWSGNSEEWDRRREKERAAQRERDAEKQNHLDSLACCANCYYFEKRCVSPEYWCRKHDIEFDPYVYGGINQTIYYKKCLDFHRK